MDLDLDGVEGLCIWLITHFISPSQRRVRCLQTCLIKVWQKLTVVCSCSHSQICFPWRTAVSNSCLRDPSRPPDSDKLIRSRTLCSICSFCVAGVWTSSVGESVKVLACCVSHVLGRFPASRPKKWASEGEGRKRHAAEIPASKAHTVWGTSSPARFFWEQQRSVGGCLSGLFSLRVKTWS